MVVNAVSRFLKFLNRVPSVTSREVRDSNLVSGFDVRSGSDSLFKGGSDLFSFFVCKRWPYGPGPGYHLSKHPPLFSKSNFRLILLEDE